MLHGTTRVLAIALLGWACVPRAPVPGVSPMSSPFPWLPRPASLRFAHAVNSQAALAEFLAGGLELAEGDVIAGEREPIMAHPPSRTSDLTLREWLARLVKAGRGIKVDFKEAAALPAALDEIDSARPDVGRLILNGDLIQGPGGDPPRLGLAEALDWRRRFPRAIISVGTTTGPTTEPYSDTQCASLVAIADRLGGPVTFALRAEIVRRRPELVQRLISSGPERNLTIWNSPSTFAATTADRTAFERLAPTSFIDLIDAKRRAVLPAASGSGPGK